MDLNNPWFGYFPIENDSNRERLNYYLEGCRIEDDYTEILDFMDNFIIECPDFILSKIIKISKLLCRDFMASRDFKASKGLFLGITFLNDSCIRCYVYLSREMSTMKCDKNIKYISGPESSESYMMQRFLQDEYWRDKSMEVSRGSTAEELIKELNRLNQLSES